MIEYCLDRDILGRSVEKKMIYADHAATTKMSKAATEAMLPYMTETWGNPSSLYGFGQQAAEALDGFPSISCIALYWRKRRSKQRSKIIMTGTA